MSATVYQQDSIKWKTELLFQRIGEWWEVTLDRLADRAPDIPVIDVDAEWIRQLIKFLLWSIIAVILVWLTWQLWLLFRPYWLKWQKERLKLSNKVTDIPEIKLSINEWLVKAQEYQKQRDYRQAIFCLYQATIQELSDRNIIPALSSRTDREYINYVEKLQLRESSSYKLLLNTHEKLCFSDSKASQSLWEKCQQAYRKTIMSKLEKNQ